MKNQSYWAKSLVFNISQTNARTKHARVGSRIYGAHYMQFAIHAFDLHVRIISQEYFCLLHWADSRIIAGFLSMDLYSFSKLSRSSLRKSFFPLKSCFVKFDKILDLGAGVSQFTEDETTKCWPSTNLVKHLQNSDSHFKVWLITKSLAIRLALSEQSFQHVSFVLIDSFRWRKIH